MYQYQVQSNVLERWLSYSASLRPAMHYTEIPGEFLKMKDEFAEKKTLIFDGIHYLHIFIWLMTKRYDKLADNLVNIDNTFSSKEEAIALMKERTKKIIVCNG